MFSLKKLQSLPPRTRLRKIAAILQSAEIDLIHGRQLDIDYILSVLSLISTEEQAVQSILPRIHAIQEACSVPNQNSNQLLKHMNALRHKLLRKMGAEPAEWDLLDLRTGSLDRTARNVFLISLYLDDIRSPFNVGAIFRTAESFGVGEIGLSPDTPLPTHPRAKKTARSTESSVPWRKVELSGIEDQEQVFALELGGKPVCEFPFPRTGTMIIGSEELGVSAEALALADRSLGRVSIPVSGAKRSLNVSVAFGIVMFQWYLFLMSPE